MQMAFSGGKNHVPGDIQGHAGPGSESSVPFSSPFFFWLKKKIYNNNNNSK